MLTRFLDEATKLDKLLVIGVTSNPQCLDPSLKGPQRLRIEVSLGIPTLMQRKAILQQKLPKGVSFAKDLSLTVMAEQTPGYLGSDLDLLVSHLNVNVITRDDLAFAQAAVPPSAFKSGLGTMEVEPVSWEDIGGLEDVKLQLKRALQWPLKHAEAFSRLDIRKSKGCLLYGPPGKTKSIGFKFMLYKLLSYQDVAKPNWSELLLQKQEWFSYQPQQLPSFPPMSETLKKPYQSCLEGLVRHHRAFCSLMK